MSYMPHSIVSAVCSCYQIMELFVTTAIRSGCPVLPSQIHCQLFFLVYLFQQAVEIYEDVSSAAEALDPGLRW